MAYGFGTTRGVATTDRIVDGTFAMPAQYSIHFWCNRNSERIFARVFYRTEVQIYDNNGLTANTYAIAHDNTASPRWHWTRAAANTWSSVGYTMDSSSSLNDPIVYQDGKILTLGNGLTITGARTAWGTGSSTTILGNRNDFGREWDGDLAEFAVYEGILSPADMLKLNSGVPASEVHPGRLLHYAPLRDNTLDTPGGEVWTPTGTKIQRHPRIIRQQISALSAISAPVVGAGNPYYIYDQMRRH